MATARKTKGTGGVERVSVENVNHPGTSRRVHAAKYQSMRKALLKAVPARPPGATVAEALTAAKRHLPDALFPKGALAGWWFKTVQLDLEAKRLIARTKTTPLRLYRV